MRFPIIMQMSVITAIATFPGVLMAQSTQPTSAPASQPASAPASASHFQGSEFAEAVEAAHGGEAWMSHEAVEMSMTVFFGENAAVDGTLIYDPHGGRVRIEQVDGTRLIFDGNEAHVSPADADYSAARFHLLTWPYFVAAPFKLRDPGSHLEPMGMLPIEGELMPAARLTFDAGVGDAPDDWYVVYRDEEDRLVAMGYIVTYFGGDPTEAEAHAVVFREFTEVDGVQIPSRMEFCLWSEEEGPHGEMLGHAEISDIRFITPAPGTFHAPNDSRIDPLPSV